MILQPYSLKNEVLLLAWELYDIYVLLSLSYLGIRFVVVWVITVLTNCISPAVNGLEIGERADSLSFDDPYQRTATLQNLNPNQEYRIFVWARTSQGRGEEYFIDVRTTGLGRK